MKITKCAVLDYDNKWWYHGVAYRENLIGMCTTVQILNLMPLSTQTSWMFSFCPDMTSSLGTINKLFNNFSKITAHFKNQSRYASGFYDVKGTL